MSAQNHVARKSIVVTGAGGGFGKLISERAAALGAKVTCADVNREALLAAVEGIGAAGGIAQAVPADVTRIEDMQALAAAAVSACGAIDVMVNNAGIMPLGLFADHAIGLEHWHRCIDINININININIKGVLNGIVAVYDQMMAQGEGHVINISSIHGNFPTYGGGVYGATKSAVNFLSDSLRIETRGKIKVTIVNPTGVPATRLGKTVVNREGVRGIVGQNAEAYMALRQQIEAGTLDPSRLDPDRMDYVILSPDFIADAVIHAIDQPKGVAIGEITVRAAGDHFVL